MKFIKIKTGYFSYKPNKKWNEAREVAVNLQNVISVEVLEKDCTVVVMVDGKMYQTNESFTTLVSRITKIG